MGLRPREVSPLPKATWLRVGRPRWMEAPWVERPALTPGQPAGEADRPSAGSLLPSGLAVPGGPCLEPVGWSSLGCVATGVLLTCPRLHLPSRKAGGRGTHLLLKGLLPKGPVQAGRSGRRKHSATAACRPYSHSDQACDEDGDRLWRASERAGGWGCWCTERTQHLPAAALAAVVLGLRLPVEMAVELVIPQGWAAGGQSPSRGLVQTSPRPAPGAGAPAGSAAVPSPVPGSQRLDCSSRQGMLSDGLVSPWLGSRVALLNGGCRRGLGMERLL